MDDAPSPQRAYKRHKSYPGETSFVTKPPSSDMDDVALLRYVDLAIVLTGIKSGTLLGATVIRCRRN